MRDDNTIVSVCLVSLILNCTSLGVYAEMSFDRVVEGPSWSDEEGWNKPEYYSTIGFVDINGDYYPDLCGRSPLGMKCHMNRGGGFSGETVIGPVWTDEGGWNRPEHYSTIQYVDIDYDLRADICGRSSLGILCYRSRVKRQMKSADQVHSFSSELIRGPSWSDAEGWSHPQYYSTIQYVNINGDDFPDVCARGPSGIECYLNTGGAFSTEVIRGPNWSDDEGWNQPVYYESIRYGNVDSNYQPDVCAPVLLLEPHRFECYTTTPGGPHSKVAIPFDDSPDDKYILRVARFVASQGGWSSTPIYNPHNFNAYELGPTFIYVDINQDFFNELCVLKSEGEPGNVRCYTNNKAETDIAPGEAVFRDYIQLNINWGDVGNTDYNDEKYYSTFQVTDIDTDDKPDFCIRLSPGIRCGIQKPIVILTGGVRDKPTYDVVYGPGLSDSSGWDKPEYYSTIHYVDFDRNSRQDVCARSVSGIKCYMNTSP